MITKVAQLKKDLDIYQRELASNKSFLNSASGTAGKAFIKLLEDRKAQADESMTNLDINISDATFKLIYAMKKEVQLEYSKLLDLLRESSKREEDIIQVMSEISDDIKRLETDAEKSPLY